MKLKNKKTGEIVEVESCNSTTGTIGLFFVEGRECDRAYSSLAELCEEWEDYEEPKKWYTINKFNGSVDEIDDDRCSWTDEEKESIAELGLKFETKEEAERAVEKLKAWERLEDNGFRFKGWSGASGSNNQVIYCDFGKADAELLNLLFGGEE